MSLEPDIAARPLWEVSHPWSREDRELHITALETKAGCLALRVAMEMHKAHTMRSLGVHTDNTVCRSYMWRLQGGRMPRLSRGVLPVWKKATRRGLLVKSQWVSTEDNWRADCLSRNKPVRAPSQQ